MGTLYVVATPIGNLGDMSPRAVQTLKDVDLIAAEDTRVTMKLCQVFDIHTRLVSCHQHNEDEKGQWIADKMAEEGISVAVTTDAGTPCISDPGYGLVKACIDRNIPVIPVPGCSASISALSISGLDTREFAFYGFLPRGKKELSEKLTEMSKGVNIAVVHESPHRVQELLTVLEQVSPQAYVVSCCDLTKLHEKTVRGPVGEVLDALKNDPKAEKGEYCLVFDFGKKQDVVEEKNELTNISLEAQLTELMVEGMNLREAQEELFNRGTKKNAVKQAALHLKKMFEE